MGNDLCHVSKHDSNGNNTTPKRTADSDQKKVYGREISGKSRQKNDDFLPCDCCSATQKCGASVKQNSSDPSRRGFEIELQTPRSKVLGYRNVEAKKSDKAIDIYAAQNPMRRTSIPPLDYALEGGSVPPSTDKDGRWIDKTSDRPRIHAYEPL